MCTGLRSGRVSHSLGCPPAGWKQLSVYSVLEEMLDWQEKVDCLRSKLTPMQWQVSDEPCAADAVLPCIQAPHQKPQPKAPPMHACGPPGKHTTPIHRRPTRVYINLHASHPAMAFLAPALLQHWRSLPVLPRTALLLLGWPAWLLKRAGAQPISDGAWFRLCVGSVLFYIMLGLAVTMPPLGVALWLILTAVWLLLVVNLAMICEKQQLEQDAAELRSCGKSARQLRDDHAALPGLCSMALAVAFRLGTCEMEARDARNRAGSIMHGLR